MNSFPHIADNVARIRERIANAACRAGRSPDEITLVAVTKMRTAEELAAVLETGVTNIGENYVPEAEAKFAEVRFPTGCRKRLIGHLQANKARRAIQTFDVIQSIDSLRILTRLDTIAGECAILLPAMLEVKLCDEPDKTGFMPDDLPEALAAAKDAQNLRIIGLMGMAPFTDDMSERRKAFSALRRLFVTLDNDMQQALSMGMSDDFETAIEEGSTMVRIGTALFGPRHR